MDRASIKELLRDIQGPNVEIEDRGEWVSTHCPLAPWTHANGTDKKISFGIKVNQYSESVFNCYACKSKGTVSHLLKRLESYTGEDYRSLIEEVEDNEYLGGSIPEWDRRNSYDSVQKGIGEPLSEDYLDIYDPAEGHWYLQDRGIDDETSRILRLCVDPDNKGVERILFPVFSPDGGFYGYTGRATVPDVEPRIRDYFGLPKRHLLLGAERIDTSKHDFVILVEGLFDYARFVSYGFPVVAALHSGLTPEQSRILKDFSLPVYVFYDNDDAGRQGRKAVAHSLRNHVPVMKVRYPLGVKDPDELTKEEALHMLEDSRLM